MILIVTLNPLLEIRYQIPQFNLGSTYRDIPVVYKAGGKGINVSRQLKYLGIPSTNVVPLGGANGKIFKKVLETENLHCIPYSIKNENRLASIIEDKNSNKVTSFFGENASLSQIEINGLTDKIVKIIPNCEIVIISGSVPCIAAAEVIFAAVQKAKDEDKILILDTYGKHLEQSLSGTPFAVHNTADELELSLGVSLKNENDFLSMLSRFDSYGIRQTYITNGAGTMYASSFGYHYKVTPPAIDAADATGSGDAFTAGIAAGIFTDAVFGDVLRFAVALGVENAKTLSVAQVERSLAEKTAAEINIVSCGKALKTLDDTPVAS